MIATQSTVRNAPTTLLSLITLLLRSPREVLDHADDPAATGWIVPRLVGTVAVGGAVFGAVVGAHHGGIQVLYAAIKMPVLLVFPLAVTLPAVRALFTNDEQSVSWSRVGLAGLVGAARTGILAAAASPFLWLGWSVIRDYHLATLVLALSLVAVGTQGALVLRHALPRLGMRHIGAIGVAAILMGLTTAQTGWLLRPFIARPTAEVTFLRPIEADIASALTRSTRSAAGDYRGSWDPEQHGLIHRGLRRGP